MVILLESVGGILCCLLAVEIAVRAYYRAPLAPRCFRATEGREGIGLMPNCRCVYNCRGRFVTVSTDALGRRNVPLSSSDAPPMHASGGGPRTIHVLGDSQACGWGLSDQETIPARMQAILGPAWRVVNQAIPVTGPHTYLELLDKIPAGETVLVLQSDDSDLIESRPDRPPIFVRCGLLLPNNWHGRHIPCWLTHSYCFQALVQLRRTWRPPQWPVPINFNPAFKEQAAELATRLEASYHPHRVTRGKRLLFSVVPWEAVIVPRRASRYRPQLTNPRRYASMPEDVDLYAPFLQQANGDSLFQTDHHLTAAGAQLAAEHLAKAIEAMGDGVDADRRAAV